MRPSICLLGLVLVAPAVFAQTTNLPDLKTATETGGTGKSTAASDTAKETGPSTTKQATSKEASTASDANTAESKKPPAATKTSPSLSDFTLTAAPPTKTDPSSASSSSDSSNTAPAIFSADFPTLAGVGVPSVKVPDTAGAVFMQKSSLPDGTVFICVGAVLACLGVAVLAWRGLVAWSLHRSVKHAAMAQNLADLKAMSAIPGKKRTMYNVVSANSNMSLDRLSAAPKPTKPFAANPAGTPPKSTTSLFFSPTAGGSTGLRDSVANRSSTYLPPGYYAPGSAQPASGSSSTQVGGHNVHFSTHSLAIPGNRASARPGLSPPGSPSLPPSRERAPPSRESLSIYNRNSVATLGTAAPKGSVYGQEQSNPSQLSLNAPGGTTSPGGRAPSAYLEDLFENHGSGPTSVRY